MYIIEVQNIDKSKTEYYRAINLTEAKLYQMSTPNFVHVYSAHEFLSLLPRVPLGNKKKDNNFDVTLKQKGLGNVPSPFFVMVYPLFGYILYLYFFNLKF